MCFIHGGAAKAAWRVYYISSPGGRMDGRVYTHRHTHIRRQTGMSREPCAKRRARVRIPVKGFESCVKQRRNPCL